MSLILKSPRYGETDFGPIFCAPWVRGFFGFMHWPLYILYILGLTWKGTGFAAKTITFPPRQGNVSVDNNGITWPIWSKAIYVNFWKGYFINAFGLSNPGLVRCLELGHWQKRKSSFLLSFTSTFSDKASRLMDVQDIVEDLLPVLDDFKAPVALQWNIGCPNAGIYKNMSPDKIADEVIESFALLRKLGIPLILNFNALMPIECIQKVHTHVDAFWIGNIIPVGSPEIDWNKMFKGGISPLIRRGLKNFPGGLSGPEAFPLTLAKIREIRACNIKTPIVAGNGTRTVGNIRSLQTVGTDAAFMGSIILRPWRMKGIIKAAHQYLADN